MTELSSTDAPLFGGLVSAEVLRTARSSAAAWEEVYLEMSRQVFLGIHRIIEEEVHGETHHGPLENPSRILSDAE